jgi:uncharacterized protein (UPF0276 family)
VATLIERDDHIPPLAEVVAESQRAAAIAAEITGGADTPTGSQAPRRPQAPRRSNVA